MYNCIRTHIYIYIYITIKLLVLTLLVALLLSSLLLLSLLSSLLLFDLGRGVEVHLQAQVEQGLVLRGPERVLAVTTILLNVVTTVVTHSNSNM